MVQCPGCPRVYEDGDKPQRCTNCGVFFDPKGNRLSKSEAVSQGYVLIVLPAPPPLVMEITEPVKALSELEPGKKKRTRKKKVEEKPVEVVLPEPTPEPEEKLEMKKGVRKQKATKEVVSPSPKPEKKKASKKRKSRR